MSQVGGGEGLWHGLVGDAGEEGGAGVQIHRTGQRCQLAVSEAHMELGLGRLAGRGQQGEDGIGRFGGA